MKVIDWLVRRKRTKHTKNNGKSRFRKNFPIKPNSLNSTMCHSSLASDAYFFITVIDPRAVITSSSN